MVKLAARFQVALRSSQASSVQVGQMMKMPWQPAIHTIALSAVSKCEALVIWTSTPHETHTT